MISLLMAARYPSSFIPPSDTTRLRMVPTSHEAKPCGAFPGTQMCNLKDRVRLAELDDPGRSSRAAVTPFGAWGLAVVAAAAGASNMPAGVVQSQFTPDHRRESEGSSGKSHVRSLVKEPLDRPPYPRTPLSLVAWPQIRGLRD